MEGKKNGSHYSTLGPRRMLKISKLRKRNLKKGQQGSSASWSSSRKGEEGE